LGAVAEWQVKSLFPVKFSKNGKKSILLNLNKFVHLATVPYWAHGHEKDKNARGFTDRLAV